MDNEVLKEKEKYVKLWRNVVLQIVIDLLGVNIKRNYKTGLSLKTLKYLKNDNKDFELLCDLARLDSSYIKKKIFELFKEKNDNLININNNYRIKKNLKRILINIGE